jgi:integrase
MMRVRLKGLNFATKRLADGSVRVYWYPWRNGPRLRGEPGTAEFVASYNEAIASKIQPATAFQAATDFTDLTVRTRSDYVKQIKLIEREFATFPLVALDDRRSRGVFLDWRDKLAARSRRQADYAFQVLARILSWAKGRGLIAVNPCERGGRLYHGNRVDKVWTVDDETAFLRAAPKHLHLPLMLGLWTGQRQGDLLRLTWAAYDGTHIRLRQGKTGVSVSVLVGAPLKAMLDTAERVSPVILTNSDGIPWTAGGFHSSWRKACAAAGVSGVTFNDLRGTAVSRLALVGCTEAEIATVSGHSLRDVRSILDAHYLHRDPALGDGAIRKLERGTNFSNRQTGRCWSIG